MVVQMVRRMKRMIKKLIPANDDLNGWCALAIKVFILSAITLVAYKLGYAIGQIAANIL